MAKISFSYDTGNVPAEKIMDSLAVAYGYQEQVPNPEDSGKPMQNPQSKEEFVTDRVGRLVIDAVQNGDRTIAIQQAQASVKPIDLKPVV